MVDGLRGAALDLYRGHGLAGAPLKGASTIPCIEDIVCLDVESTGLGTGPGTVPFLVGLAWVETSGRLVVEQRMMGRFDAEPAMLDWLTETLQARGKLIITYNGSTYDLPLLESRYVLHRRAAPFGGCSHLDCIWPARQLWKGTVDDASLGTLERSVFGHTRPRDLPGSMIPGVWTRYVRTGDRGRLDDVLAHNVEDLVTLLGLASVIASAHRGEKVGGVQVQSNLGWMRMRRGVQHRAVDAFQRALAVEPAHLPALRGLARAFRKLGERDEERTVLVRWIDAEKDFDPLPYEALAKNLEHHMKDYADALRVTEDALSIVARRFALQGDIDREVRARLEHRRARLRRRIGLGATREERGIVRGSA